MDNLKDFVNRLSEDELQDLICAVRDRECADKYQHKIDFTLLYDLKTGLDPATNWNILLTFEVKDKNGVQRSRSIGATDIEVTDNVVKEMFGRLFTLARSIEEV